MYCKLLSKTELQARRHAHALIPVFLDKHRPQTFFCRQDLELLGIDCAESNESDDEKNLTKWEALGHIYTLEVISARLFQFFAGFSSIVPPDMSRELNYFSEDKFIFKERWTDFMNSLSCIEQGGVNRFQFDEMLEGVLNSLDVWESCFARLDSKSSQTQPAVC